MAVLNRDEFFTRIQNIVGTDTSDESMNFIEDMTDTYNDMETRANGDGENWEQRYHDLDASWRERYRHRFFSGNGNSSIPQHPTQNDEPSITPETITIDDLFK